MDIFSVTRTEDGFYAGDLIEGYDTCIWTERYAPSGDFKMVCADIELMQERVPEGMLITHRGTKEIMEVQTHLIEENDEGIEQLTITGETFDSVLKARSYYDGPVLSLLPDGMLWSEFVEYLLTSKIYFFDTVPLTAVPWNIPNLEILNTIPSNANLVGVTDATQIGDILGSNLYEGVVTILNRFGYGIRTVRGTGVGPYNLTLEIYAWDDRSLKQSGLPQLVFQSEADDLTASTYLHSRKAFRNVAIVKAAAGWVKVTAPGVDPNIAGLDRRVMLVDANDISEVNTDPGFDSGYWLWKMQQRGYAELATAGRLEVFDGQVSPESPYVYGVDYFLGDRVSLQGAHDVVGELFVSEYILSETNGRDIGYPSLVLPSWAADL